MAENTKIEWCTHTMNFWYGCSKVSPACQFCYAESWAKRSGLVEWEGERRRSTNWTQPDKWNTAAKAKGVRETVFCLSLGDFWDNKVPAQWRGDAFRVIERTPHLTWLILSKRVGNAIGMVDELGLPLPPMSPSAQQW